MYTRVISLMKLPVFYHHLKASVSIIFIYCGVINNIHIPAVSHFFHKYNRSGRYQTGIPLLNIQDVPFSYPLCNFIALSFFVFLHSIYAFHYGHLSVLCVHLLFSQYNAIQGLLRQLFFKLCAAGPADLHCLFNNYLSLQFSHALV